MSELMYIYAHVDVLILVMARIIACIWFLPLIGETKMPKMAIAGFSLCIAFSVYFGVDVNVPYYNEASLFSFTVALVKEFTVGIILGFIVKVYFQVLALMGSLLSMQGGISMSTVMDPTSGIQSTAVGRIYTLGFTAFFLVSGGYHWVIKTLVDSFEVIPINQVIFRADMVKCMIAMMATYFELGLKLALPIIAVIIIIDFSMGIMAKSVPQINMFVVGIPLKMIVMFMLMIITVQTISEYSTIIIEKMVSTLNEVIQGMGIR